MVKYKVVRNYNDANTLIEMGNKLIKIDRDRNNRDYLIFLFEYNDKVIKDLNKITFSK